MREEDNLAWMGKDLKKMAKEEKIEEKKTYKNPILYLRKSKKGDHLYAFNVEKEDGMVLGGGVGSLIVNVSDMVRLIDGETDWIKVSVLPAKDAEDGE